MSSSSSRGLSSGRACGSGIYRWCTAPSRRFRICASARSRLIAANVTVGGGAKLSHFAGEPLEWIVMGDLTVEANAHITADSFLTGADSSKFYRNSISVDQLIARLDTVTERIESLEKRLEDLES